MNKFHNDDCLKGEARRIALLVKLFATLCLTSEIREEEVEEGGGPPPGETSGLARRSELGTDREPDRK